MVITILVALYCLLAGITMSTTFLFMGLFKHEQQIIVWGVLSALFGVVWPISVPGFFIWIYLPSK